MTVQRKWIFRVLSITLGLSVFAVFEGICRVVGWGSSASLPAAFDEFAAVRPLFQYSDTDRLWQIADNRREFFAADSFAGEKSPTGFRVFVFGGSTVQGRPFSVPTSFASFLEIALHNLNPHIDWEVVNCGGISYASYRLLPIMEECVNHQPDLYIVCTGHNEFLECVTYNEVRQSAAAVKQGYALFSRLNSFRLFAEAFRSGVENATRPEKRSTAKLSTEVDAILDHSGGLELYTRSRLQRAQVVTAFADNVQRMVAIASAGNVPLLLIRPPSNLRDCPPFKSQYSDRTDESTQRSIIRDLRSANTDSAAPAGTVVTALTATVQRDRQFALSWYQLGQALLAAGRPDEAKTALQRARDEDVCPLRMTTELELTFHRIARQTQTPILDAHTLLESDCKDGIAGNAVLVDHVHPSFSSNQKIAIAIVRTLLDLNVIAESDTNWEGAASVDFRKHLQSLDNLYYLKGRRTLETLRAWAAGRAEEPPLKP